MTGGWLSIRPLLFVRALLVVLASGLLAFQVVRTAAVRLDAETAGAQLWQWHADVLLHKTMGRIGALSARGEMPPPALLAQVDEIARKSPLAPEPFLIKGAVAQTQGYEGVAERLYLEARNRDPRSRAARYFLAERFLRSGRPGPALAEMAILARLTTGAAGVFGPALASYAQTPGAVPYLHRFFRSSPDYELEVLLHLSADIRNLELILTLWSGRQAQMEEPSHVWLDRLTAALMAKGEFAKAHSVWSRYSGVERKGEGLFNPQFRKLAAPPPFNWKYGTAGGVAEPAGNGRLRVIHYGREDGILAEQLLMLARGNYQLSMDLTGNLKDASAVLWSVECLPQNKSLLRQSVQQDRSSARIYFDFSVPAECPAQRLQLAAEAGEFPNTSEFTVSNLQLTKGRAR